MFEDSPCCGVPHRTLGASHSLIHNIGVSAQPKRWHVGRLDRVDHLFGPTPGSEPFSLHVLCSRASAPPPAEWCPEIAFGGGRDAPRAGRPAGPGGRHECGVPVSHGGRFRGAEDAFEGAAYGAGPCRRRRRRRCATLHLRQGVLPSERGGGFFQQHLHNMDCPPKTWL